MANNKKLDLNESWNSTKRTKIVNNLNRPKLNKLTRTKGEKTIVGNNGSYDLENEKCETNDSERTKIMGSSNDSDSATKGMSDRGERTYVDEKKSKDNECEMIGGKRTSGNNESNKVVTWADLVRGKRNDMSNVSNKLIKLK